MVPNYSKPVLFKASQTKVFDMLKRTKWCKLGRLWISLQSAGDRMSPMRVQPNQNG